MKRNSLYVYGTQDIFVPSDLHLGRYVLDNILKQREDIALVNVVNGCEWSFGEIAQQAVNVAVSLTHAGVEKGQVVGVCSEPRLELVTSALGILCAGATVACIDGAFHEEHVKQQMRLIHPKILFTSIKLYNEFHNVFTDAEYNIEIIVVFDDGCNEQKDFTLFQDFVSETVKVEEFEAVPVNGVEDVALIGFSSGTTGNAKGIQLTHHALLIHMDHYIKRIVKKADRVMSTRHWSSCFGLKFVLASVCVGATSYFAPGDVMTPATLEASNNVYEYVQRYQISVLLMGPAILSFLLSAERPGSVRAMRSLRLLFLSAATLFTTQAEKIKRFCNTGFMNFYGMSEIGIICSEYYSETPRDASDAMVLTSGNTHDYNEEEIKLASRAGLLSVGRPYAGVTLKVVNMQNGAALGPNQLGEICVKSFAMMKGYLGRDLELDEEGWLRTGDAGHYDLEGRVYLWDRIADLLHVDGNTVSPSLLEGALLRYPGVVGAGVTLSDGLRAYVELADDVTISERDVQKYVEGLGMPGARLSGGVRAVRRLPRAVSGKLERRTLAALGGHALPTVLP